MLNKLTVKQRFKKATATYDEHALIQKKTCMELAQTMDQLIDQKTWDRVLEIGCGTGGLTQEILKYSAINTLYLNDLYEDINDLKSADWLEKVDVRSFIGDIEQLELPLKLDLVISSAAFQWMIDLPTLLQKIHNVLNHNGYLVFSTFGTDNLREIKQLTGQGLDYHETHVLQRFLMDLGFEFVAMKYESQQLQFNHPREVLQHLKNTGVTAVGQHRWTKSSLAQFYQDYQKFADFSYSAQPSYPLTYSPIQCIVRKK